MKANELRIDNVLEYSGNYFKVKSISQTLIYADRNRGQVSFKPSELNPIPLSKEILLKCEFEENGRDYELCSPNGIVVEIRFVSDCYYLVTQEEWGYNGLLYLHQLQNLYFALTGEELDVSKLI